MGNTLLNDDAIGIIIVRYLWSYLRGSGNIEFKESSWGGFKIIDLIKGYDYLIVIDSIKTGSARPGHIHKLKSTDLLPTLRLNSYHDINFITAIKLAEALNEKMPSDIDIFAVEVENNYTIVEDMTEEVKSSIAKCSKLIVDLLKNKKLIDKDFDYSKIKEIESEQDLRNLYLYEESYIYEQIIN
jgi:hydrogenase maturation protease